MTQLHDVFISHSHRDQKNAEALRDQLTRRKISAYVDFADTALSKLPNAELATRLIEKLRMCRLLVFAFSEEAVNSRWMPWELGLAHGIIGRVVLWPFTEQALRAKATQEYLHLYEVLTPDSAMERLQTLVSEAKSKAVRPADVAAMQNMAGLSVAELPRFNNPNVAREFMVVGPFELYTAWLETVSRAWLPK